jgi:hypothetical protein
MERPSSPNHFLRTGILSRKRMVSGKRLHLSQSWPKEFVEERQQVLRWNVLWDKKKSSQQEALF